ncbi:Alpha/beta hydrolase [Sulfidibacter corallicola]|uniref:Alpha/beta hydrolase n=1 Tax=Sulfidibacter corallicola TaxID=2818388 RepID=A0A8A4TMS0_SULCO|nr:alpha/beta hydrolase-fold protein [Sulfidibacter corallicola]QTD51266.1 alpha/beta hydrolase [Sulfidibacter corallicola]
MPLNPTAEVRIHYPLNGRRMVLRTSNDWHRDVSPTLQTRDKAIFTFWEPSEPLEFKPMLVDDHGQHWSQGRNYTLYPYWGRPFTIYPHFFEGATEGTISEQIGIPSDNPDEQLFTARIYMPPGYRENTLKRYPVLYMHDGTNLFFPDEAFLGREWQVDETMNLLNALSVIDKTIVVGIYAANRNHDYTHPGYHRYGEGVVHHLKTHIDRNYRTLSDPIHTGVMGSSLGGVVSFYLAWQWPKVFGKVACMSSTFGYRDDLYERVRKDPKRPVRIYLDSGWPEDNFDATKRMKDLLIHHGFQFGSDLLYFNFPLAGHHEGFWAARLHIPFQFLFGKNNDRKKPPIAPDPPGPTF